MQRRGPDRHACYTLYRRRYSACPSFDGHMTNMWRQVKTGACGKGAPDQCTRWLRISEPVFGYEGNDQMQCLETWISFCPKGCHDSIKGKASPSLHMSAEKSLWKAFNRSCVPFFAEETNLSAGQCESFTPLTAHKKAIEAYMKERPELKNHRLAVRNFEAACRIWGMLGAGSLWFGYAALRRRFVVFF